jgi:hypothetical protein
LLISLEYSFRLFPWSNNRAIADMFLSDIALDCSAHGAC